MTHLPGCFLGEPWDATRNPFLCICDRLRACEDRGRAEQQVVSNAVGYKLGYAKGRAAALDAARDAVAAKWCCSCCVGQITDALTAIDALKGATDE